MLECLSFLLQCTIDLLKSLFKVDVGFTSLGTVFCIVFILFPTILAIVNYVKTSFVEELDERYDETRPYNHHSATYSEERYLGKNKWGNHAYYNEHNTVSYNRRLRRF